MNKRHTILITTLDRLRIRIIEGIACKNDLYALPTKAADHLHLLVRRSAWHVDLAPNAQRIT
ncbi:hypothetical protein D3C84_1304960 [compost metagenome]